MPHRVLKWEVFTVSLDTDKRNLSGTLRFLGNSSCSLRGHLLCDAILSPKCFPGCGSRNKLSVEP